MSEKSKRYDDLAADIRAYKAELTAIGLSKESTTKLDGFASQIENLSAELGEPDTVAVDDADLPIGKLSPSGPVLTGNAGTQVPDAQTQLNKEKATDATQIPSAPEGRTVQEGGPVKPKTT